MKPKRTGQYLICGCRALYWAVHLQGDPVSFVSKKREEENEKRKEKKRTVQ